MEVDPHDWKKVNALRLESVIEPNDLLSKEKTNFVSKMIPLTRKNLDRLTRQRQD